MTTPAPRGRHNPRKKKRTTRRRLPMRYLLPSLLLVALLAMLMLRGYVHSEILADHRVQPPASTSHVPDEVLDGGPVIDARTPGERAKTLRIPDHKIVLTFDDGPDPVWTPKVLDQLKKYDAHGVFFVTGTMASRYPALVQRMVDRMSRDRRMAKVNLRVTSGGTTAAANMYTSSPTPNLIVLETAAEPRNLLAELAPLAEVCDPSTRVIVIGRYNDIALYRELVRNGISEYLVAPVNMADLLASIAAIFVAQIFDIQLGITD